MDQEERLKAALADRYLIEREIGSGGMATVYLAADLKHDRKVAVKVLKPELAAVMGTERFLAEIRTTANLQHPHILPLHDSGEADGFLFYVMPYVEGESLRERINREGQLPLDVALQITKEVAAALSYAHSHNVIHRDIKPENVLLSAGEAVVADFGIARAISEAAGEHLTGTGLSVGTPAYMSPEQASGEQNLDGRTDVYSLGCLLYEMLAGEPPYTGPTAQAILAKKLVEAAPRVSVIRDKVPLAVEAALDTALSRAAADRHGTAGQFADALTTPRVAPREKPWARGRKKPVFVAAGVLLLAAAGAGHGVRRYVQVGAPGTLLGQELLAEHDRVLVADFENQTDDSLLAAVVTGAVEVALTQSRVVRVLSPEGKWEGMRRMGLDSGDELPDSLFRQLALRENAKAYVSGDVSRLGSGYRLTARVVGSEDGEVVLTEMATAQDEAHLIHAVDDLCLKLRRGIGESLRRMRGSPPLEQVTSGSVQALRSYSQAIRAESQGDLGRALRLLEEAVAADSAFAMAYRKLGVVLSNTRQQPARRAYALTQAYVHRNRLTEVERFRVIGMYHLGVTEDWEASLAAYQTLLEFVPDDVSVLNNLAFLHWCLRDNATGVEYAQQALELDSSHSASYGNVATGLFLTGNLAQAETILERTAARFPGDPTLLLLRAEFGTALGEYDAAQEAYRRLADGQSGSLLWVARSSEGLAQLAVLRGKFREAEGHWRDALIATERRGLPGEYLTLASRQALAETIVGGQSAAGVRRIEEALERYPLETLDPLDRPYGNLVLLYAWDGQMPRARVLLAEYSESGAAEYNRLSRARYRWASGVLALAEGRSQEAIDEFRQSDDGPCLICALPWLALAHDVAGDRDAVILLYEQYLTTPWLERLPLDYTELPDAYLRLGELHEERGNQAKAREYYNRFVELWAEADPELQPRVKSVRGALERVQVERLDSVGNG